MKNKYKLLSVITACILLAAFTVNQLHDVITFAVEGSRYLESVEIFTAPTKAEAKEKCKSAGYLASDADLNEFNSGGAVVLGYKITDDPDEAITDMSVLEMNNGYEVSDYADIKEAAMEKAGFVTSELKKTVSEYSENLQAGSPKAIKAQQILNIYVIPEMNNMGLGDYLAGNTFTEDFLKKIICQANAGVIYAIFNSLSSGVADFGEDNWAERVEKSEVKAQLALGNENALLDSKYKDFAYELCDQLQFFAENYAKAKQYTDNNGMKALEEDIEKTKEGDISDETMEKLENGEKFDEKEGYVIYLAAYELLSKFRYDESTTVAQYILNLGNSSYKTDADLRKIYPLVDALTLGQIGVFRVSGITQMALALSDNSVVLDKTNEAIAEIYDKIKDAYDGKTEHLSIWTNTDQTQYNTKIAKTSANIISTNSGMEFNNLTKENRFEKKADEIIALTYVIGSAIDIAGILTTAGAEIAAIHQVGFSAWLSGGSVAAWTVCSNAIAFTSGSIFTSILGLLGCTAIILGYVAFAAIICVTLYQIGKFFYDLVKDEADTMDYSLDDIPNDVYDYRNQAYLHYKVVKQNGTGKGADLNAENGRRFAALYFTRDENAGEPIEINPDGDEFKVISGDTSTPDGFESVRYFSHGAAANLNSYAKNKDAKSLFLSYYKSPAAPINEGEESEGPETASGKTEYLESLSVSVQNTEAAAKDALKKAGYTLIDINLSGFYGKKDGMYTYLGYKTTTIAKEAVTDIRIVPQGISTGSAFYFGNNAYTRAGGDDIPANIPSIYFSKSPDAGTPIYPDLQVTNSRKKANAGFEPVNLFCGGEAYNLNATGDSDDDPMSLKYSHWNDSTNVYIYFHPSVTYTEGQKYIGGMAFFTGKNTSAHSGDEIMQYAESNGFSVRSDNFTEDYKLVFNIKHHVGKGTVTREKTVDDIVTYLGYSMTYNPYRAIYGIKSYTAISPAMESLNEMMLVNANASSKESYAACNVFYQFGNEIEHGDEELKFFSRGILDSNAWNGINEQSRQTILPEIEEYPRQEKDDSEDYTWETSAPRLKNLYVCGYVPGKTPLSEDDIVVTSSIAEEEPCSAAGLYSVQDMKTPNRAEAHNIGISSKNPMYLFFRQDKPSQGRYISSISLASWNFNSYIGDDKSFQSMSSDDKEAIMEKYGAIKDDLCITNALQSCGDEIINRNLAVKYDNSKQASSENEPAQAAYIGVTRTDNSAEAIHSVIKFKFKSRSEAELKIKVGGTEFTRVGKEPIYDEHMGAYFLYVSKSGSAPGEPITSISFSDIPIVENCATVLTAYETDVTEYSKGKELTKSRAKLKGYANESNYIHCEYETQRTYICDIFIASGATEKAAMLELLDMGCNMYLPIDMNKDANGNYIFLGYDRAESKYYAVRDIICTVGKKAEPEIEVNGAIYQRARDRFIMNYDDSGAVSFNEGTNGYSIYLYYTYDTKNEPIMKLAAAERDYVPDNQGAYIWEPVLTDTVNYCNFNDGVYASGDGHSVDNRIYLYGNRIDNSMKPGLKLPKGSTESTMAYGELKTVKKEG